jgi:SAM-dependent methyltransferase
MPHPSAASPWLTIPLEDYERHMALPHVAQAQLLRELLAKALRERAARSVAVLGCAGGNGFDCVPSSVERIVGVDINAEYVAAAHRRFGAQRPLELHVADLDREMPSFVAVELVFAALLFEYVAPANVLPAIAERLTPGGTLLAVLQLPSASNVTPSPYDSLGSLAAVLELVPPEDLASAASRAGLTQRAAEIAVAAGGKRFAVLTFENADGAADLVEE